jgi:hypothetical protein
MAWLKASPLDRVSAIGRFHEEASGIPDALLSQWAITYFVSRPCILKHPQLLLDSLDSNNAQTARDSILEDILHNYYSVGMRHLDMKSRSTRDAD